MIVTLPAAIRLDMIEAFPVPLGVLIAEVVSAAKLRVAASEGDDREQRQDGPSDDEPGDEGGGHRDANVITNPKADCRV
jgi:hypothetical protein